MPTDKVQISLSGVVFPIEANVLESSKVDVAMGEVEPHDDGRGESDLGSNYNARDGPGMHQNTSCFSFLATRHRVKLVLVIRIRPA